MPSWLRETRKTVVIAFVSGAVVLAMCVWFLFLPHASPEFEVTSFKAVDAGTGHAWWWGGESCRVEFRLTNTGQKNATCVHGTLEVMDSAHLRAKYAGWTRGILITKSWRLPGDFILRPGETSQSVVISLDELPADTSITITVECDEGVIQQFVKSPQS